MASIRGSFARDDTPVIQIAVASTSGPSTFVDAIIDTGFTGFLQVPAPLAHRIGLIPQTTTETQFSDGRIDTVPLAWGRIVLGMNTAEGFVHVQRGRLLRSFRKTLVLSVVARMILLVDNLVDLPRA